MHGFTPISIAGALTSLVVTPALLWVVWRARRLGRFQATPFVGLLLFESLFLVAYMTFLSFQPSRENAAVGALDAVLGAVHGVAALVVFVGFWALLPVALQHYHRGRNLFADHGLVTWSATILRGVALLTGEAIFILHWIE